MWGMMLKDMYVNRKDIGLSMLGIILCSVVFFIPIPDKFANDIYKPIFILIYLSAMFFSFIIASNMLANMCANDEKCNFREFAIASPVMARGRIKAKYITNFALMTIILVWCELMEIFTYTINDIKISMIIPVIIFAFFYFQTTLETPLYLIMGSKYGNYVKMGIFYLIIIIVVTYLLYGKVPDLLSPYVVIDKIIKFIELQKTLKFKVIVCGVIPAAISCLYYISYRIAGRYCWHLS